MVATRRILQTVHAANILHLVLTKVQSINNTRNLSRVAITALKLKLVHTLVQPINILSLVLRSELTIDAVSLFKVAVIAPLQIQVFLSKVQAIDMEMPKVLTINNTVSMPRVVLIIVQVQAIRQLRKVSTINLSKVPAPQIQAVIVARARHLLKILNHPPTHSLQVTKM